MSYSLNEITALCKRAARGAGLSWGLAAEAGFAARWLAERGLPGPEVLAQHLGKIDGVDYDQIRPLDISNLWQAKGAVLCPLITGAAISDLATELVMGREIELDRISYPLLLMPFIAVASALKGTKITLLWPGLTAGFAPELRLDLPDRAILSCAETTTMYIKMGQNLSGDAIPLQNRAEISPDALRILAHLGHRTYAPDTTQSRLSGAGAGLSDND